MTGSVLIAYASRHGHTEKVARRVAERLEADGLEVRLRRLDRGEHPRSAAFDAVVVAASVHAHAHQREVVGWARQHAIELSRMPSALLSVSLTAADDDDEARAATRELIDDLLDDTGWAPAESLAVAGALQYAHYDLPTRTLMRLVAARHGGAADVDHDVEFTDWEALDAFSDRFATRVTGALSPSPMEAPR